MSELPADVEDILTVAPGEAGERIAYGCDPNQFGELRLPKGDGPHPVVMFIHGGFWRAKYDLAHVRHLCVAIAGAGLAVWSVEYRRVGQPGGGCPGTLDDIRAAALRIRDIPGLDLERVLVVGHSAGGHLALWLAAQETIALKGVVALGAVSDLRRGHALNLGDGAVRDFVGGGPEECGERYAEASPMDLLPIGVPQVLVHGTEDAVVPFALSERFVEASGNAELVALPGAGHLGVIDPLAEEWGVVLRSIVRAMPPSQLMARPMAQTA